MTPPELEREAAALRAQLGSLKRALKVMQGQQRHVIALLAAADSDLASLRARLELTAEEAQNDEHYSGTEIFV